MDEWSKSQNVSSEQTDRTVPPHPPQAQTEHVNVVFTGSGNSDDLSKIQKGPPPSIIVNNKTEKDKPIKASKKGYHVPLPPSPRPTNSPRHHLTIETTPPSSRISTPPPTAAAAAATTLHLTATTSSPRPHLRHRPTASAAKMPQDCTRIQPHLRTTTHSHPSSPATLRHTNTNHQLSRLSNENHHHLHFGS
ncbi:hypothetical protein Tco_0032587 [Tanacetum coccineum]